MATNGIKPYLTLGLIAGIVTGWLMVLFGNSNDLQILALNLVLALKIMSIVIPVASLLLQGYKQWANPQQSKVTNPVVLLQPLGLGSVAFVAALALFLVPILIALMVIKGVDGVQLRELIYQQMNWQFCFIGLAATIVSFYINVFSNWIRSPQQ